MNPTPTRRLAWATLTLLLAAMPMVQAKSPTKGGAKPSAKEPDRADLRAKANPQWVGWPAPPEIRDFKATVPEPGPKQ